MLNRIKGFFMPPQGSSRWMYILPFGVLAVLAFLVLAGGAYGWEYTNSPGFCGYTCHTMPPQNATYLVSPHANVYCTECHIGRAFIGQQFARKSEDVREIYAMVFNTYEFPIRATRSRPALETCEKCHHPETFSDDSLRAITHFADDPENTPTTTYLIMKTGGGSKREGLSMGIHWHIANKVQFYATDNLSQDIPYIRKINDNGSITEYVDVESGFDPKTVDESKLQVMDCTTCHNRVSHDFKAPAESMDVAMAHNLIDTSIPEIHAKGVEVLNASYANSQEAATSILALDDYYKANHPEFYTTNIGKIQAAISTIQDIYARTFFIEQKVDWKTYPNNLGHISTSGCFRCHDGKHLDDQNQAIRLECNLCHSIPEVAGETDFLANIEISRGPEPESHLNPNWISLHNQVFDQTCSSCHSTANAGGIDNTSFCSNSACHGSSYSFAGFDAPKLREILKSQLPAPTPAVGSDFGALIYDGGVDKLLVAKCGTCHGAAATGGLDVTTFASLMKGGTSGAVIVPNDSANSLLVKIQGGQHFMNLSADELKFISSWIDAGVQEK